MLPVFINNLSLRSFLKNEEFQNLSNTATELTF